MSAEANGEGLQNCTFNHLYGLDLSDSDQSIILLQNLCLFSSGKSTSRDADEILILNLKKMP